MKTLDRYILSELGKTFLIALFILMSILSLEKINFIANMTMGASLSGKEMFLLLLYTAPAFLVVTIPLAVLMAVLIGFSRMSADHEIIAMRACGMSFPRLLVPVIALSTAAFLVSLWLAVSVAHRGNYMFNTQLADYVGRRFTTALGERNFFDRFPDTVIYVNEKPAGGEVMKGVFIFDGADKERPRMITAAEGGLERTAGGDVVLHLEGGSIYSGGKEEWRVIRYGEYGMVMNTGEKKPVYDVGEREMEFGRLAVLADTDPNPSMRRTVLVEMHKRLALPFACIVLGLLAAPLGVQAQRGGGRGGVGIGIVLTVLNYLLLMLGEGLGRQGRLPPGLALWLPNIILGALAAFLLYRVSREMGPMAVQEWWADGVAYVKRLLRKSGE